MSVIVVTDELGTLGGKIARAVADRLDLGFADREFLDERVFARLTKERELPEFLKFSAIGMRRLLDIQPRAVARTVEDEIRELVAYGNVVIRGWGAASLLRDNPHVLRVCVTASPSFRVRVLASRRPQKTDADLIREIDEQAAVSLGTLPWASDATRQAADDFDLTIASETTSVGEAVDMIEGMVLYGPPKSRRDRPHRFVARGEYR